MRAFRSFATAALLLAVSIPARAQSAGPIPDAALEWLGIPRGATMLGPTDRAPAPPRVAELAAVEPAPPAEAPVPTVVPIAAKASQEFVVRHVHTVAWTPPPASASPVTAAPQSAAVQLPTPQSAAVQAPVVLPQVFTTTVQALATPALLKPGPIRHAVGNVGRFLAHADDTIHVSLTPWTKPPAPTVTTASAVQTLTTTVHQTTVLPPPAVAAPPVAAVQVPLPTPAAPTK